MSDQFLLRADGSGEPHRRTTDCDRRCLPVVVISPEDREQVERLIRAMDVHFDGSPRTAVTDDDMTDMQAALREFANPTPPKPVEPLGLGAVVEDAASKWVRWSTDHAEPWTAADWTDDFGDRAWSDFSAVRVLSEGVTP